MDAVREKLIELEKQYNEISDQLISDEVISNPRKITKLSKEQAQLSYKNWILESCRQKKCLQKKILK